MERHEQIVTESKQYSINMQLTGKQIADTGIIMNYSGECIQQQGIDCRVIEICDVRGEGYIPREGKTKKCISTPIPPMKLENGEMGWKLEPGYYEVTFAESCNIPGNAVLHYDPRSSLVRCGGKILSGQFDGGFKTDHMGCFMELYTSITIEQFARIAQARVEESYLVDDDDLYNGQWQGDKQRKV